MEECNGCDPRVTAAGLRLGPLCLGKVVPRGKVVNYGAVRDRAAPPKAGTRWGSKRDHQPNLEALCCYAAAGVERATYFV